VVNGKLYQSDFTNASFINPVTNERDNFCKLDKIENIKVCSRTGICEDTLSSFDLVFSDKDLCPRLEFHNENDNNEKAALVS
jgi:hypothetical protein